MKIRIAKKEDIPDLVRLSDLKRRDYEKHHLQFWKRALHANDHQEMWFYTLLEQEDYLVYLAEDADEKKGFVIGRLIEAPAVYAPGGLTLMIDDFCVASPDLWSSVGVLLFEEVSSLAQQKGAVQTIIVSGAHDTPKRNFLKSLHLTIASEWYVGKIK